MLEKNTTLMLLKFTNRTTVNKGKNFVFNTKSLNI